METRILNFELHYAGKACQEQRLTYLAFEFESNGWHWERGKAKKRKMQ
jgi:hypothetical protein